MYGTVYTKIQASLLGYTPYQEARSGRLSRRQYAATLDAREDEAKRLGLTRDQFHLSGRFPPNEEVYVDVILADLEARGAIPTTTYDKAAFTAYRGKVAAEFSHGELNTYIFPEEERLVYALAEIARPTAAGVFGSYYGYWAIWIMPAVARAGGRVTLIDLDPRVSELGRTNFYRLGYGERCEFITADAVRVLEQSPATYDFVLIDAEGPDEHADPDYRKKWIYHPIFRACVPRLRPGALVAAHNMLLSNPTDDRYFDERIQVNKQQFNKLLPFLEQHFSVCCDYPTSEGVGVYRL